MADVVATAFKESRLVAIRGLIESRESLYKDAIAVRKGLRDMRVVEMDLAKLLGFRLLTQATGAKIGNKPPIASAKIGNKPNVLGARIGLKPTVFLGAKVGGKIGTKPM